MLLNKLYTGKSMELIIHVLFRPHAVNLHMPRFEDNVTIVFNYPVLLNRWYIQPMLPDGIPVLLE